MATKARSSRRHEDDGTGIPKDRFWSYVLYICHVGDLSLLEQLLSQYHDQPVRLNHEHDHINSLASDHHVSICFSPTSTQEQQESYSDNQYSADDEDEDCDSCGAVKKVFIPPKALQRTTTLWKKHSNLHVEGYLASAPSLPDAMLLAALLGAQVAIVDYLITEFRPFLSLNDALISATLEGSSSLKMLKILHNHYPHIIHYRFNVPLRSSPETDLQHESLTPSLETPTISILQEAMSRSQINPDLHKVILFLFERGALLDDQESGTLQHFDIIQWATWTAQPLPIIRACLEQGKAKVDIGSIYFAVQHGDYELLHLLLACGKPTKEQVSTGELIRLARLPATAFTTDNEEAVSHCCAIMREYLLARVIHNRAHPSELTGASVRRRTCSTRCTVSVGPLTTSRRYTENSKSLRDLDSTACQDCNTDGQSVKTTRDFYGASLLTRLHSLDSDVSRWSRRRDCTLAREELRSRSLDSTRNEFQPLAETNDLYDLNMPTIESPTEVDSPSPWTTIRVSPRSRRHITFNSAEALDVLEVIEEGSLIHVKRKTSAYRTSGDPTRRRNSKGSRRRDSSIVKEAREKVRKSLSGFFQY